MGWIIDLLKDVPLSTVIREQLIAAEKKALLLESENAVLNTKIKELESENAILNTKIKELESENKNLRQEIQRRDDIIQKEKSHNNLLDEIKTKILVFLSNQGDRVTADQIAYALTSGSQIVEFHLKELKDKHMISDAHTMNAPTKWLLAHEGRRYLIENKLIS